MPEPQQDTQGLVTFDPDTGRVSAYYDQANTPADRSDDLLIAQGIMAGRTADERTQNYLRMRGDHDDVDFNSPLMTHKWLLGDPIPSDGGTQDGGSGGRGGGSRARQVGPGTSADPSAGSGLAPGSQPGDARVPAPSAEDRGRFNEPDAEQPPADPDAFRLDVPAVAIGAMNAIAMTLAGIALAAFSIELAIAAAVVLVGYGVYNGLRAAAESGNEEGALGRIVSNAVGDVLPINPIEIGEAYFGIDYISGEPIDNSTRNERLGSSLGGFTSGVGMSAFHRAKGLRQSLGRTLDAAREEAGKTMRSMLDQPPRGYIVIPIGGPARLTKLEQKLGCRADQIVYSDKDFFIASDRYLKDMKRGQGTGQDSNHLALAEWFRKGPASLQGVEHFVPAYLLGNGMEHQGTFHGAFNEHMRQAGLFQKSAYSRADIDRALTITEKFYRNNPGGDIGRAWANAVRDFTKNVYSKF